jgi:superfamily I DNA/RNA helicase
MKISGFNDDTLQRFEFPHVFVVGMEDLFSVHMSMSTRSELEEERRLFYVALTGQGISVS